MAKKITVECHGPIALSRGYQSPWEDVWLSWTEKPGRRKRTIAPTLCSWTDLERELGITKQCKDEYPEHDWDDDLRQLTTAAAMANYQGVYISPIGGDGMPSVWTKSEWIDREEADRMIAEVMKQYGYESIRCKWKRPKTIIIPS